MTCFRVMINKLLILDDLISKYLANVEGKKNKENSDLKNDDRN